jgi:hypothetical protein
MTSPLHKLRFFLLSQCLFFFVTIAQAQISRKPAPEKYSTINAADFGAIPSVKQDNTSAIQAALDALPETGGKIVIPSGCKFHLAKLKFRQKMELEYYANSDIGTDSGHTKGTNEQVTFSANAANLGVENEMVYSACHHPAFILDARKDIKGQNPFLGKPQNLDNPVRSSFVIRDEGMGQIIQQYSVSPDYSNKYSGFRITQMRNTYKLQGITERNFSRSLSIGEVISVENGMGAGNLIEKGEDFLTVQWLTGRFKKGDKVAVGSNKCNKPIGDAIYNAGQFNSLSFSHHTGYIGVGIPNDNAVQPFTVGGRIGIQGTRPHSQYIPEQITQPAIVFANSFEEANPIGLQLALSFNKNTKKRLVVTDYTGKIERANAGAVMMHTSFSINAVAATSSFNVARIVRESQGIYTIYFTTSAANTTYQVSLGTTKPLEYAFAGIQDENKVQIRIVKTGTDTLIDPTGNISVICTGGDM